MICPRKKCSVINIFDVKDDNLDFSDPFINHLYLSLKYHYVLSKNPMLNIKHTLKSALCTLSQADVHQSNFYLNTKILQTDDLYSIYLLTLSPSLPLSHVHLNSGLHLLAFRIFSMWASSRAAEAGPEEWLFSCCCSSSHALVGTGQMPPTPSATRQKTMLYMDLNGPCAKCTLSPIKMRTRNKIDSF